MSAEQAAESFIKTPKQLIMVVVLSFLVPVLFASLLAYFVVTNSKSASNTAASMKPSAVEARIKPVASVVIAQEGATKAHAPRTGEEIVKQVCSACHGTGAAGSPKIGDKEAWAKYLGGGLDPMLKIAISGKGAMPPRGGLANLSNFELARAIVYMANKSGGHLTVPEAPKPATPGAERTGKQVVEATCIRCHGTGLHGAPKIGDKAEWAPRIAKGIDVVTREAIRGHGAMPARGGLANLTDHEITSAILYMFTRAGAPAATGGEQGAKPAQ